MRPREWVYRGHTLMAEVYIDFSFESGVCEADIVQCSYSQRLNADYQEKHFFAEGPNGKYYKMIMSPNQAYHWAIRERVWRPNDDHEKLFYNKYYGRYTNLFRSAFYLFPSSMSASSRSAK